MTEGQRKAMFANMANRHYRKSKQWHFVSADVALGDKELTQWGSKTQDALDLSRFLTQRINEEFKSYVPHDAGMGFGRRNIEYNFPDKESAKKVLKVLKRELSRKKIPYSTRAQRAQSSLVHLDWGSYPSEGAD